MSQAELIATRSAWADLDKMKLAVKIQGQMLVSVRSRMHTAEEDVKNLKRAASREDTTPKAKKMCVDEAVRKIFQLNKETKLTAKREAAKHSVISQTRISRGLASAGEPSGAMLQNLAVTLSTPSSPGARTTSRTT